MPAFTAVDAIALAMFAGFFGLFLAPHPKARLGRRLLVAAIALGLATLMAGLAAFYHPRSWPGLLADFVAGDPLSALKLFAGALIGSRLGRRLRLWRERRRADGVWNRTPRRAEAPPEPPAAQPPAVAPAMTGPAATGVPSPAPSPPASIFSPPKPHVPNTPGSGAAPPGRSPGGKPWGAAIALFAIAGVLAPAGEARAQAAAPDREAMRRAMLRGLLQSNQIVFQKEGETLVPRCRCGPRIDAAQVPQLLANALVATEDRRFFDHYGIDPIGLARGAWRALSRSRAEGGSTLTQQLVKNAVLTSERSLTRKAQEAQLALALEKALSKQEIIAAYLNAVSFGAAEGREIVGARQAALEYFGREPGELDLGEVAGLVGMLNAPTRYSRLRNPQNFEKRRQVVLQMLEASGRFTKPQIAAARRPLRLRGKRRPEWAETRWFVEIALAEIRHRLPDFQPTAGTRIAVPFVFDRQLALEAGVARGLARLGKTVATGPAQVAAVALGHDGRLLAVMGGRDYGATQFNRALAMARPAASTYKILVYAAALDAGTKASPALREAFAKSENERAIELARALGVARIEAMARRHGIASPVTIRDPGNVALGANAVGAIEMSGAMLPYVNAGRAVRPWSTFGVWKDGEPVFWKDTAPPGLALTAGVVAGMAPMLRAVVTQGTAKGHVRPALAAMGKTGTSDDNRDAWFVGATQRHVVGVWMGRDDNQPVPGLTGGAVSGVFDAAAAALAAQTGK